MFCLIAGTSISYFNEIFIFINDLLNSWFISKISVIVLTANDHNHKYSITNIQNQYPKCQSEIFQSITTISITSTKHTNIQNIVVVHLPFFAKLVCLPVTRSYYIF